MEQKSALVCVIILSSETLLVFGVIMSPVTAESGEKQFITKLSFSPLKFALRALSILDWVFR